MALNESALAAALKDVFRQMRDGAGGTPKDDDWYAEQLAKAVTDQIKTAGIAAGKVITAVSGGSGNPAEGTPNAAEINVQ